MPLIPPPRADLELEDETSNIFDCQNIPDGWKSITSEKNKALGFLWETGSYTFETSSGVKITVEDISDVEIYENKETGEVVVVNANGATITSGSKDAKISVYDSIIDKIDTSKGNDEVNIYNSKVNKIDTGRGIDYINIENSDVDDVQTGSGNDTVNISNSNIANVNTSSKRLWGLFDSSEDTVILNDSTTDKIKTGRGEDNIVANNSTIEVLNTGFGSDSVNINQTEVGKNKGNKKDTVVQDSNYLDIDLEEIANINSNAQIEIDEETTITVNEYVNYLLEQEVGFETEEEYQEYVLQTLTNNLESMKSIFLTQENSDGIVSDGYNVIKELTGLGISDKDVEELISKQEEIINGLTAALNGESNMSFEQAYEYYTGTTYSQEKIDKYLEVSNIYSAVMVGCQYDEDYMEKFEEATGKSIEDVSREFALCQLDTFGKSTGLQDLVEKYSQDQENFADKLSSAISTVGMACTVVGAILTFFPPTTGVGMGFLTAGRYLSLSGMFVDNAIDLVDNATDSDGLTKDEIKNLALETGVEAVSYAAGRGIGKFTNGLNSAVTSKLTEQGVGNVTSYIAGQAAETVVDTGLSLGADYAIAQGQSLITTGEFMDSEDYWSLDRFLGEGKNQLIGILTGLSSAKVSAYQQGIIKTAQEMVLSGDTDGAKTYLKKSGVEMDDKTFEGLVKNTQEVEAQIKMQASQVETTEAETSKPVEAEVEKVTDADTDVQKPVDSDTVKLLEAGDEAVAKETMEAEIQKPVEISDDIETKSVETEDTSVETQKPIQEAKNGNTKLVEAEVEKVVDTTLKIEDINAETQELTYDEKVKLLTDKGVWIREISGIAKLEGEQFTRALELADKGVIFDIREIAELDDVQYKRALELVDKGVKDCCIKDVAEFDDAQYSRAFELAKRGVVSRDIIDISKLEGKQYARALELADKGLEDYCIKDVAEFDDVQYSRALKLADKKVNSLCIVASAEFDDKQYNRALELADKGATAFCILEIVELDDEQYNRALKYIDKGIDEMSALALTAQGIDLFAQMDLVEVSKDAQTGMFKNFFANHSTSDEIIRNTDFSQYGKEGIPLEYSRTEFLGDLSAQLTKLPAETQTEIIKKLGIDVIKDESGNITGYDGIIDLTKLSTDGSEGKVLELANHFILNNKVVTGDSEVDSALNSLISGMPEFINTIGKQQHGTHSYSLDTHILETYKAAISDSDYDSLSNYKKFELKLMTILHDISKGENVVDDNHPLVSAKYAKDILSRYSLSESTQYDIVNNILNHHWGKDYNTESVSTEETAVKMGTLSNYDLQRVFARADLIGMGNSEFSSDKIEGLSDSSQENLVSTLHRAKETSPLVYTTPIIKPDLIPSKKITLEDGTTKTIRSFNLAELPDDYDMEEFGFLPGTKAKDVTLGVHTANSQSQFDLFEMLASDPIAGSPQSVSIVSKDDNALFKRFGIAINLKAADVINATHYDQGCGILKTQEASIELTTGDGTYKAWREILPNKVQEKLGITPSEYYELSSTLEDYKYLTQIKDSQEITIGEKTFTGGEIKLAISTSQTELMQMATSRSSANDGFHYTGDITELVVKRAEVMDNTYILRFNSADDINNENIPTDERKALGAFLAEIPENSTVIFVGYDGYLYSDFANQWNLGRKAGAEE